LANDAPISSTKLIEQLGCLVDIDIAKQIVEGSIEIPHVVDDTTALILDETGKMGVRLTNREVTIVISKEEFHF